MFLPTSKNTLAAIEKYGSPLYLYDEATLLQQGQACLSIPHAYGLTVRYAVKANTNRNIVCLFDRLGLSFETSSGEEAMRLLEIGIEANKILLTPQQLPDNFKYLLQQGVLYNATSVWQLQTIMNSFKGKASTQLRQLLGLRFNPGIGSGKMRRTNVGGLSASFGIWHEEINEVQRIFRDNNLTPRSIHTHIGSGADARIWQQAAIKTLRIIREFPSVTTINLGGGFKVACMPTQKSTDIVRVGEFVQKKLTDFYHTSKRKLHLEIEPGTFLVANAGVLVATVKEIVSTGKKGYVFLKLDCGMNNLLRPTLYGAEHFLQVVSQNATNTIHQQKSLNKKYVVVGHCCESGDIFTTKPGSPEYLKPRTLPVTQIGDKLLIAGTGAYCASMNATYYNSFSEAAEVLLRTTGKIDLIKKISSYREALQHELKIID